jgi:dTDP-L-rhamnose 4-epimerase
MTRVLVTGGAGFIGSHLVDELLSNGYKVRVLDNLEPQVHGEGAGWPAYLSARAERLFGDVCDPDAVARAVKDVDAVFHFAAAVGVGQSMYKIADYTRTNNLGTAVMLEALSKRKLGRLVVASSMSVYGEGLYKDSEGNVVADASRDSARIEQGQWDPVDVKGAPLQALATPETKAVDFKSVYAQGKYDQERMCLMIGETYRIPTVALRFFNAYGPRQALSNPYTGVLAIFAARLLNDRAPLVFEDGAQRRDFVHVRDVAKACRLALESDAAPGNVINVGSGECVTVKEVAERLARTMNKSIAPELTGKFRVGDIRHCFADITKAKALLGYEPGITMSEGMTELSEWLGHQMAEDRVAMATQELKERGLTK